PALDRELVVERSGGEREAVRVEEHLVREASRVEAEVIWIVDAEADVQAAARKADADELHLLKLHLGLLERLPAKKRTRRDDGRHPQDDFHSELLHRSVSPFSLRRRISSHHAKRLAISFSNPYGPGS